MEVGSPTSYVNLSRAVGEDELQGCKVMVTPPNYRLSHMHPAINRENAPDPITSYGGKFERARAA